MRGTFARTRQALIGLAVAAGLAVPVGAHAAAPLAGEWHFDTATTSGGADSTPDSSGSGQHLAGPAGSIKVGPGGRFGSSLTAANTTTLAVTSPLLAPQKVTLLAWIKLNAFPGTGRYIAGRGEDGPGTCLGSSYALYTGYPAKPGLTFYVRTPNTSVMATAATNAQVFDNQWHLIAGVYDGASVQLFIDGQPVGTPTPVTEPINYSWPAGSSRFYVDGYPRKAPDCFGDSDWPGPIDEVRVYDRNLTKAELTTLAAPGATPPSLPADPGPTTPTTPTSPPADPGPPPPDPSPPAAPERRATAEWAAVDPADSIPGTALLDASGSQNAERFDWDLGGDGVADVTCPGDQPVLSVSTAVPATKPATLTTFGPANTSPSRATPGLFVGSSLATLALGKKKSRQAGGGVITKFPGSTRLSPQLLRAAPPDVASCSGKAVRLPGMGGFDPSAQAQAICLPQTVIWGLASAKGCFYRYADAAKVPEGERRLLQSHYDSERYGATAVAICNLAARGERPQDLCDRARAMFEVPYDVYVAKGTVDLNGIKITPDQGKSVAIFPKLQRIVTSGATMKWGSMTVRRGPLDFNFENDKTVSGIHFTGQGSQNCACGKTQPIVRYDGKSSLPNIAGFQLDGQVDLSLEGINGQRVSSGRLSLRLPDAFSVFGQGHPPNGYVTALGRNDTGPEFDELFLEVQEANLGPLRMEAVKFHYKKSGRINNDFNAVSTCERNEWRAQAKIFLAGGGAAGTGIDLTPPPSQNGVGFCDSEFRHAGGFLNFEGAARPQLFPGITLNQIGFALQLRPFLARGTVKIGVADFAVVDGGLLMALATPNEPYTLTPSDAGPVFGQLAGRTFTSTTIMGGGAVSVQFPYVGMIPVGAGAAMWSHPDHIAARGEVALTVPGMRIFGYAAIEAMLGKGLFTSSIGGSACLGGVKGGACLGGDAWVTSKGAVACLNILDTLHPGAGVNWQTRKLTIWPIDGCKPSRYWVTFNAARASRAQRLQAADTRTFRVGRREDVKNVQIEGAGAPPKVKVTAPDGETLTVDGDDWVRSQRMAGVRTTDGNAVYVGVKDGPPGIYTVERVGDSVALGSMRQTREDGAGDVGARLSTPPPGIVRASAARASSASRAAALATRGERTLRYDAGPKGAGVEVTFSERAGEQLLQEIRTVQGGEGELRFTPAAGPRGKRQIVAQRTVDGIPGAIEVVATYTFGGERRLAAPKGVTVKRKGTSLVVSWKPVAGASSYGVVVELAGGGELQATAGGRSRRLTIKNVARHEAGRVRVSAKTASSDAWGRTRTSPRFKALAPVPTVLQTAARNEKKGNF